MRRHYSSVFVPEITNSWDDLLREKVTSGLSWDEWAWHRRASSKHIYRNEIIAHRQELLAGIHAHPLRCARGAYLSPDEVVHETVKLYADSGQLWWPPHRPARSVLLTYSFDNRTISRVNEFYCFAVRTVREPQNVAHV